MNASRLKHFAIHATVLSAMLVGTAGVAMAQKVTPAGPPVTTKGAVKSNPKADKGQATAEAARVEARQEKAEKLAMKEARKEPKSLLKGIELTSDERKTIDDIDKRYTEQLKDLQKADAAADKAGTPDADFVAKIDALRLREREEVRAMLTPEQRIAYDSNIATLGADKKQGTR